MNFAELEWWQWAVAVWLVGAVLVISFLYWKQPELPNDDYKDEHEP